MQTGVTGRASQQKYDYLKKKPHGDGTKAGVRKRAEGGRTVQAGLRPTRVQILEKQNYASDTFEKEKN